MTAINKLTREDVEFFEETILGTSAVGANTLSVYQQTATKSAIYPGRGTPLGLAYVALKLNGEAGEFAEHVGKAMRDDALMPFHPLLDPGKDSPNRVVNFTALTDERRDLIIKEVGDVLWYLSAACNELGISLSEAALINLTKLADRAERGALRGSGDDR